MEMDVDADIEIDADELELDETKGEDKKDKSIEEASKKEDDKIEESVETIDEGMMDKLTAIFDKVTGIDKFTDCSTKEWEGDVCSKLKSDISYASGVKSGFEKSSAVTEDEVVNALAEVEELKNELNEVNLLNAKLLYTNKLFRAKNLSEVQKVKVLESFDNATTVKETKLVFDTLSEGIKSTPKKSINEVKGSASKAVGSS